VNISVRPLRAGRGHWHHDWDAHQHEYHGMLTLRLTRPGPGLDQWIPLTFCTCLTLDFSVGDPFAPPPPPSPPHDGDDRMDTDARQDTDQASCSTPTSSYTPLSEDGTADRPLVVLSDSVHSGSDGTGWDETMSDTESGDEDEEMPDSGADEDEKMPDSSSGEGSQEER